MESDSKLICKRGIHHHTHNLEIKDISRHSNILRFAYNRQCLDVHSNKQFYAELWVESDMEIFSQLECKVGGK